MFSDGSVTGWFQALQHGDRDAAQRLWERFARRLIGLARKKLQATARQAADEEDVVLSAFDSFCRGAEQGRFAHIQDRGDLWQLLMLITVRKAIDLRNYEHRLKRGGPTAARGLPGSDEIIRLENLLSREPDPELAALLTDECARLLGLLGDSELQTIALLKMEGYTDDEVAERLGCARRTVQRRLRLIRQFWESEAT